MAARRLPDVYVAAGDLAFAIAAFACGLFSAPLEIAIVAAFGMVAFWLTSRRPILDRLKRRAFFRISALAIAVLLTILSGAYWLGLGIADAL
jgi:hypothetical protein